MASGLSPIVQEIKPVSKYWKHLNNASKELLSEYGIEIFKETVARVYNDDGSYDELMKSTAELWDYIYETLPNDLIEKLSEPLIGSPRCLSYNGKILTTDLGVSFIEYYGISKCIDFSKIERITEIGGGYGRLAYVILILHPNIKYTMCDVEPALSIAKWYLPQVLKDVDLSFISPDQLKDETDISIACNCLHEMTPEQVHYYFDFFDNKSKYVYYNCWNDTTIPRDGVRWERYDYPIKNRWTELFNRDFIRKNYFEALYRV
jgi:hypothetical protein